MSLRIGVLMGGVSEEKEISLATGNAIIKACKFNGHIIKPIIFNGDYSQLLSLVDNVDIVFNALHGGIGENGEIQSWLKKNNIRYTGSEEFASKLCMNKAESKKTAKIIGLKTPKWEVLIDPSDRPKIDIPFVVKPNNQGSTVGLTIVEDEGSLDAAIDLAFKYSAEVLIEEFIAGRELTVSIVGEEIYPIVEIFPSNDFYDYECKYTPGKSRYTCPAEIEEQLEFHIKKDTELIFKELGCIGYGRADYLVDNDGDYYFLEMNTLPGMTVTSLLPKSANAFGLSFNELVERIIGIAF